jgi:DNA repair exonuclease SbcCD ATPase subunit
MFLQVTEVNNDALELRCLETNLTIAKKWARNAINHIARVLNPVQFTSAFTDGTDALLHHTGIEEWDPPPPPTIQFMPDPKDVWKKDIPSTITKQDNKKQSPKQHSKRRYNNQSQDLDMDNNTTTTANTQSSYTQDTISELQNNSYQHQQTLENHIRRIDALDKQVESAKNYHQKVEDHNTRITEQETSTENISQRLQTLDDKVLEKFSAFSRNLATLEEEQQIQQRHSEQMTQDIARCSTQLPTITETMEEQQQQLIKYFRRQNKINAQHDKEIKKLRATQDTHQTMISTLQAIVLQLQNSSPSTPLSQQRVRKRLKPRIPAETSILEDSDMESDDKSELHQMHAIATLQNHSIEQLSFIAHQTMDESDIDDLPPWDDDSTENEESVVSTRDISTQEKEDIQDDPEHPHPGNDT